MIADIQNNIFIVKENNLNLESHFIIGNKLVIKEKLIVDFSELEITKLHRSIPHLMRVNLFLLLKLWFKSWNKL